MKFHFWFTQADRTTGAEGDGARHEGRYYCLSEFLTPVPFLLENTGPSR